MVNGTPSSLLSEPIVAIVGAALESTAASRSLVLVLPWLRPPAVEHGRRGYRHGVVAHDRPAGDHGDLAEAERDHATGSL